MPHVSLPRLTRIAAMSLVGLGTVSRLTFGHAATPAVGTPASGITRVALGVAATPVAGTPVPAQEAPGQVNVNVFVEVNTSLGLGTVSTGEQGIHIQRIDSCEARGDEP